MKDEILQAIRDVTDRLVSDEIPLPPYAECNYDDSFFPTLSAAVAERSDAPEGESAPKIGPETPHEVPPSHDTKQEPPPAQAVCHDIERLIPAAPWSMKCTSCLAASQMVGPFDLVDFRCPQCRAQLYPFLEIEGRHVDLWRLRTFLINIYYSRGAADAVLLALSNTGTTAKALELDLPPRLILAHALAALLVHIDLECEQPFAYYLMGCIFPLLPWAFQSSNLHEFHETLRRSATEGPLSSGQFNPEILPFKDRMPVQHYLPDMNRLEGIFAIEAINGALQTTDHEGYSDSLGELIQEWSIAIDRRRKNVVVENAARDLPRWEEAQIESFCQHIAREATIAQRNKVAHVLDIRLDSIWHKCLPVARQVSQPLDNAAPSRVGKLIEVVDHRYGGVFRALIHVKVSGPMIGVNCQVLQQPPSSRCLYYNKDFQSAEAALFLDELHKVGASKWDTELGRTATDLAVPTMALSSVMLPIGAVWLLGWVGYIGILTVLGLALLRVHRRRWFPLPGHLRGHARPGFLRSYFGLNYEVGALRAASIAETARKWGQADVASRPSLTAQFMRPAEVGRTEEDDLQFGAWVLNEQVSNGVISAARGFGIDMDDTEKEILNLVNHGVIANTVMGNASVQEPPRSPSRPARSKKARRDEGSPGKRRNS